MPIRSRTLWLALATLGLAQAARAADDTPPADPNLARWAVAGGAGAAAVRDAAAQGPVRDNAGLFKDETIRLAEKRIEEIRKRYDRDVLVVTFEKAPEDLARPVDFAAWVKKLLPP